MQGMRLREAVPLLLLYQGMLRGKERVHDVKQCGLVEKDLGRSCWRWDDTETLQALPQHHFMCRKDSRVQLEGIVEGGGVGAAQIFQELL